MKITPVTKFQTEDGHRFDSLQEAEHHMDVLDLAEEIMDECHVTESLSLELAQHLYDKYDIAPIPQPRLTNEEDVQN